MRINLIILFGLFIGLISCKKDNPETKDYPKNVKDYREKVIGEYTGIRVDTYWIDTIVGYGHDTTNVTLILKISQLDSIVDIDFIPPYSVEEFSFKYINEQFISTSNYHPPTLILANDSLYFKHQPGLGPIWTEMFTKKTN
jgi:hypothetical protein